MDVTVCVGTFGSVEWLDLARSRAIPSAEAQAPVVHVHGTSLAQARNAAAAQAESEWLCFLDADDELAPGFVKAMGRATADLRIPAASYVRHGKPRRPHFWPDADIRQTNYLVISTLVRRELFNALSGFADVIMYEDWHLFARALKGGATVERVPEAVLRVHVNPASPHRSGASREQKLAAHEQVRRLVWPELYGEGEPGGSLAKCPPPA